MRTVCILIWVALASAVLLATDLPFWGEENGEGTNVVATATAVSAVAKQVGVRTVCVATADPFAFSSYRRGLCLCIK